MQLPDCSNLILDGFQCSRIVDKTKMTASIMIYMVEISFFKVLQLLTRPHDTFPCMNVCLLL